MKNICFTSLENFYEEARVDIDFEYNGTWYSIDYYDPFFGESNMRICTYEDLDDESKYVEYESLYDLVHNYKIGERTLAEIICDENDIPRSVLPVKNNAESTRSLFEKIHNQVRNDGENENENDQKKGCEKNT